MHDHEIYDYTPSSYLDDIADIGEKHICLSYPNFILLLARLDTDYNYAQYLVRCLYANHLADELRHPNMSGYLEEQDELSNAPEPDQPTFSPAAPHSDIEVRLQIIDEYLWLYEKYSSNK